MSKFEILKWYIWAIGDGIKSWIDLYKRKKELNTGFLFSLAFLQSLYFFAAITSTIVERRMR